MVVLIPSGDRRDGAPLAGDLILDLVRLAILRVDCTNQAILCKRHEQANARFDGVYAHEKYSAGVHGI